jgi:hypothetical protein
MFSNGLQWADDEDDDTSDGLRSDGYERTADVTATPQVSLSCLYIRY